MHTQRVRADMQIRPYQHVYVVLTHNIVQVPGKWFAEFDGAWRLVGVKIVGTQKTTPSGGASHPSTGGEWSAPTHVGYVVQTHRGC